MVGLYSALSTSSNSVKVNSEAVGIIAGNIANAGNENYIKKIIKLESQAINGVSSGVIISAIENQFNEHLKMRLDTQSSVSSKEEVIAEYLDRINLILGNPSAPGHLSATLNDLYKSFAGIISAPDSLHHRQNIINSAENFSKKIKNTALEIQKLRHEIDIEINKSASYVNELLKEIKDINGQINSFSDGSLGRADTEQLILDKISKLAKYLDINYYKNSNNNFIISTSNGITILDDFLYSLEYNSNLSINEIIAGSPFSALKVSIAGDKREDDVKVLISAGKSNEVKANLKSGRIIGLQKLRDEVLTDFIERLDVVANSVIFNFNKHHNQGAGTTIKNEYIGERLTTESELRNWGGKVRVGVVDLNGKSINLSSEEDPNFKLKAFDLDLANLKGKNGNLAGKDLSIQDITNEINQYFMNIDTQNRVKIGHQGNYDKSAGINDIKLVSGQNLINENQDFTFDFELHNNDDSNFIMEILDLKVDGTGGVLNAVQEKFISKAGERQRTNEFNVVNLSGVGSGIYEITAKIKVTNQDTKVVSVSNVTYKIEVDQANNFNKRFSASSATGDNVAVNNAYGASIVYPRSNNIFLKAEVVNKDGNPVSEGEAGFLSIKSNDSSKYRIVIDDNPTINGKNIDSSVDLGVTNINDLASGKGFSHFYGLNNFFVEKEKKLGAASSIEVNNNILKNPNLFATAKLRPSSEIKEFIVRTNNSISTGSLKINTIPTGGEIIINGFSFNLTNNPTNPTDIDISSGSITGIVNAILNKLNSNIPAIKNNGVDLANYEIDPNDSSKILIRYNTPGPSGNNFAFGINFTDGDAEINNGSAVSNGIGSLKGGDMNAPKKVLKKQYYQSILKGNKQVAEGMAFSLQEKLKLIGSNFNVEQSVLEFNNIHVMSYIGNKMHQASENNKLADMQYNNLKKNFRETSEVGIDEELSSMIITNVTMQASSKMIATISQMFEYLMNAI